MEWQEKNNALVREFTFPDFASALAFVNQVGEIAEGMNHHPDVELSWGKVVMSLSTHSGGKVTEKDHQLANAIDNLIK